MTTTDGTADLDCRIFGPIEVWADGMQLDIGGARQKRLFGALVLAVLVRVEGPPR